MNHLFLKTESVWVGSSGHKGQKSPEFIPHARLQQSQTQLRCFDGILHLPFIWNKNVIKEVVDQVIKSTNL